MARVKGYSVEDDEKQGFKRGRAGDKLETSNSMSRKVQGEDIRRRQNAANFGRAASRSIAMDKAEQAKFNRSEKYNLSNNLIESGKKYRNASSSTFPKSSQSTAEQQRRAYERQGMLGRAKGIEMTKTKPKYQPAQPPTPPRKGGDNIDKGYTKSSNPAKNRQYPGTVKQVGKALEDAYNRGQARGARLAGAKTTSIKGRIPKVRQVRQSTISPVTGKPIRRSGGSVGRGGSRGSGARGGGAFLPGRTGFGEQ